jgi:quinol monooxygenase YgiN
MWIGKSGLPDQREPKGVNPMDITIRAHSGVTTLVNVLTVEPENQAKLLQLLQESTENCFSKLPGYIAGSCHKSQDGRRVVLYGQWRSPADIEAFRTKPEIAAYFKSITALAQFDSMICEPTYVHHT